MGKNITVLCEICGEQITVSKDSISYYDEDGVLCERCEEDLGTFDEIECFASSYLNEEEKTIESKQDAIRNISEMIERLKARNP